jgi:hypothetical protein
VGVFEENFTGCHRLQLQELTKPDIRAFIQDKMAENRHFQRLSGEELSSVKSLQAEIVEASSGVFLWVYLVVRSLLEGLENHDSTWDLRARFKELPTDLENLYYHMGSRVPERYRPQASRLLQTVEEGTAEGGQLSLLGQSFAADEDTELLFRTKVGPLSDEEIFSRHEPITARLNSRCIGLIKIHHAGTIYADKFNVARNTDMYPNRVETMLANPHAVFLHRTVYEFVSAPGIRQEIRVATVSLLFSPLLSLA